MGLVGGFRLGSLLGIEVAIGWSSVIFFLIAFSLAVGARRVHAVRYRGHALDLTITQQSLTKYAHPSNVTPITLGVVDQTFTFEAGQVLEFSDLPHRRVDTPDAPDPDPAARQLDDDRYRLGSPQA